MSMALWHRTITKIIVTSPSSFKVLYKFIANICPAIGDRKQRNETLPYPVTYMRTREIIFEHGFRRRSDYPDSKAHAANMKPTWVLSAPDGPHVGPMNLAIRMPFWRRKCVCEYTQACDWNISEVGWWLSNYIHYKVWDKITYTFPKVNDANLDVWKWIWNLIPHFTGHVITYPCWNWS